MLTLLLFSSFSFGNEFNCKATINKKVTYAIEATKFSNVELKEKAIIALSRFYECTQSHDFWDAYSEYGHGRFGTAHGIYKKCILQTKLASSCINSEFMDLVLAGDRMKCVSKLSHLVDNEFGANSSQYIYMGKEIGKATFLGHSDFFYLNDSVSCESNHFGNCKKSSSLNAKCLSTL